MALPTERTVTGTFTNPVTGEPYDGTTGAHYVVFEPVPARWTDQGGNQILLGGGRVNLDVNGHFEEDVVCTDAAGVLPGDGRLWRLRQYVGGTWENSLFEVPEGTGSLDITDILSVDVCGVPYVPVPGPTGPTGATGPAGPQGAPGEDGLSGGLDTGITGGGDISASLVNPLAVDINPFTGQIVDYLTDPVTVTPVASTTVLTVVLDSIAQDRTITWLLLDAGLNVYQQEARPSPEDRRNFIVLGMVAQEGGAVFLAQSIPTLARQPVNQLYDLMDSLGAFPISGNDVSPHGADLLLNVGAGQVFSRGWNHFDGPVETNNPHIVTTVGAAPAPWVHTLRASTLDPSGATTVVDVANYDSAGTLTPVGGTTDSSVVHQLWMFPTNEGAEIHVLQYGQQVFATLDDAVAAAGTSAYVLNPALPGNAVQLGFLAVRGVATDLSDASQALFIKAGKFASGPGGGAAVDLSGYALLAGAQFTGNISSLRSADSDIAQSSRTLVNTSDLWRRLTTGEMEWGSGSGPLDSFLRRLGVGLLAFVNTDFLVGQEGAKAFRFRQSGGALDLDASGADLFVTVFELADFAGDQQQYLRLEAAEHIAHASGVWQFSDGPNGAAVHTLDGLNGLLGLYGAAPVAQQAVTGERSTGAALAGLLTALDLTGLISDTSTAGPAVVETVNGEAGPDVVLNAADVGAVDTAEKGVAGGVATLDGGGLVPAAQLPPYPVTSVNTETGAVVLSAADVGAIATTAAGAPGGVATLDGTGKVPSAQLPTAPVISVNGETGAVVLSAADVGALTQAAADSLYVAQDSLFLNVKEHGAVGDGVTDDEPAINALLDTSPEGSVIVMPPAVYATDAPLIVPPGKTLMGLRANLMKVTGLFDPEVSIRPLATFTGVAAILLLDQATGGYAAISGEQRLLNFMIDGSDAPAGMDGLQAKGNIQNVGIRDVTIKDCPNSGIFTSDNAGAYPYSWRMHRVMIDNNQAHGMYSDRMVDLTAVDCQFIGNFASGLTLNNSANTQLIGCRAEWNGNQGFYFSGDWGLGAGSGGALMTGCSTDRNGFNGIFIDVANTNAPLVLSGIMTRRDGRNGGAGGGGYAGIAANATPMPVIIGDWTNFPGVDDGGAGTSSPQYGGSFTGCDHVQIDSAYLHAATEALHDGGGNQPLKVGANVTLVTGTTAVIDRTFAKNNEITVAASDSRTYRGADFVCTGTDDHLVIQQAIGLVDAAPGKGVVRLLDGTFHLGATVNVPDGTGLGLVGTGWGTVLRLANGANTYALTLSGDDTRARFADFRIDGNLAGQTAASGGIWAPGAVECVFQHINFTSCQDTGLFLGPITGGAFGHNNYLSQCLFDNATTSAGMGRGIHIQSNDENMIASCDFQFLGGSGGAGAAGIYDEAGTQIITGCNFVGGANSLPAIRVQDATATKVAGCNFDGVGGDGVFLAASNCIVEGNTVFGIGAIGTAGAYSGVHLEFGATNNLIDGNSIASHTVNGAARSLIREESVGGSGNNLVTGNMLITNGTLSVAALDLNAPGTLARDNKGGGQPGDVTPPVRTAAGAISDATFAPLVPPDGSLGLNTANSRLYVRSGGAWGYASVTGRATPGARYVAASNATAAEKSMADYVCDGTADNVEVQAAITAVQAEGGGVVRLSPGGFSFAATVTVNGTVDEDNANTVTIVGCGQQVTEITCALNVNGFTISDWAQVHMDSFCVFISGTGIGIRSVGVYNPGVTNMMSFWHSSFKNLRINGGFNGTYTTWGMELDIPWRSVFENIEIEGCRNGIKIINNSTVQNAGDCTFNRFFVEIVGNDGYCLYFDSIDGNMNQNNWIMFEGGASGTGCTGIYLGGTVGTASQRFYGLNLEQFQTIINVANGESNEFYCNYVTADSGQAGNKAFVCGTNSYNNVFQAKWVNIDAADSLKVIEDNNNTSNTPNIFERIRMESHTGSTVTFSRTNSTVFRDITTFNTGNAMPTGLLQYPMSTVNSPDFTPEDHGLLSWTSEPGTISGVAYNLTAGQIYLSKIKIVNRSTVVSNILYGVGTAQVGGTAAQNFVGLYSSTGTLLVSSADQTTNFSTTGNKTAAITPQTLAVGTYYVAFLANHATTAPAISASGGNTNINNIGLTTATARALNTGAGNTTLAASITLGSQSVNFAVRWAGFS